MDDTGAPVGPQALFGAVLRSFRKGGLRQSAAKIPINFSHLAKWERGERPVPQEMVAALDRAYTANGTLITLHELIQRDRLRSAADAARLAGGGPAFPPATGGHEATHRARGPVFAAISAATGTPVTTLKALAELEELAGGIRSAITRRDGIHPQAWDQLAREHALAHCTGRPGALLGRLTLDYARLSGLLGQDPASATVQHGLLRTATRLAALLAMQWADLGEQALAAGCWQQARTAADAGDDHQLRVWVRARQAHCDYWAGQPAPPVACLIGQAVRLADGTPSPGLALACATGALLAADRNDTRGTHAALEEFHAITGHLPDHDPSGEPAPPVWDLPAWIRPCHHIWPSLLLGQTTPAARALEEAEKLRPPGFPGHTADLHLYRAHLLTTEGDLDQGLDLAVTTAQTWPLTPARRRILTHLLQTLPTQTHPAAQTLHHLLHHPAP